MRAIIYVPPARQALRTRRSIEREVRRLGHEPVGQGTDSAAVAYAAWASEEADLIAGRPEHLIELTNVYPMNRKPWALAVTVPTRPALRAAVLAPLAALAARARRHPAAAGALATAAAVAALAACLVLLDPADDRPDAGAPPAGPSSRPTAPASTLQTPRSTPSHGSPPPPTSTRTVVDTLPPSRDTGGTGEDTGRPATTPPVAPPAVPPVVPPATSPPAQSPAPGRPLPPPWQSKPPGGHNCAAELNLVLVQLCLARSSG